MNIIIPLLKFLYFSSNYWFIRGTIVFFPFQGGGGLWFFPEIFPVPPPLFAAPSENTPSRQDVAIFVGFIL